MSRRVMRVLVSVLLLSSAVAVAPASAQTVHSLNVGGGWFFPRGIDSRPSDDVFVRNYFGELVPAFDFDPNYTDALLFQGMEDFRSGTFFGEWNVSFGHRVEVGAGVGFYKKTVPTVYRDIVNGLFDPPHEIAQEIGLRIVPITGVVRFMPFGRAGDIQPYVGAGIAALNYRYSEKGEFVDVQTGNIFCAGTPGCQTPAYVASGTAVGGVWLIGVKLPFGGDIYGMNVEYRRQYGTGKAGIENGFVADKIDLGGGSLLFSFTVRF